MPACFTQTEIEDLEPRFPILGAYADELSRLAADDPRVPRTDVYLLTRQMVLLERMLRRLQLHADYGCDSAFNAVQRDFAVLRKTNTAFMHGNSELEIVRLDSDRAQELLAKIEGELAAFAEPIAALQPTIIP
ncbi:MAG: hypothetical protein IPH43_08110 [Xanthomonadales bacterium]|uniref:hypothetical protein n=1 Tax=Dokdonella sp. TaxID=2291710 RepID=UPI0031C86788|nr:hypothetical protein [Xanthomonadales bacterium]MBK7210566.1 hypothetical protein [Xanthomonadales bacterium]MBL0223989.1 hypothetical protein [Xanthomonadales bacterium]